MVRARRVVVTALVLAALGCARAGSAGDARVVPDPSAAPMTVAAPIIAPATPPAPPPPPKTLVATARVPVVHVYPAPGADAFGSSLANPNELDQPLVFRVITSQPDWLQVMLPARPNGATGWIRAADVSLTESEWRLKVELGAHRLTVWKGDDVVRQETVAVGMSSAPTPTGDYYVTELLDTGNPRGPYGPLAFGLSAFSNVYTSFAGGPGQVGLHGTNDPSGLGRDVSHGCIRVGNDVIRALAAEVPIGTPIEIVA